LSRAEEPELQQRGEPYFKARKNRTQYHGPGLELMSPRSLNEIRIGYFGPADPNHPDGGTIWLSAQQAIEEANSSGGFEGVPFRLVPAWSDNPWGTGVSDMARMVYQDHLWAIVGGIDGASTHLAEQVVAKARLTLVSPVSTDKTVNLANVAWMFSSVPGDHLLIPVISRTVIERLDRSSYVLISATDHDSRCLVRELFEALATAGPLPAQHLQFSQWESNADAILRRVKQSGARAAVVLAGVMDSALVARSLRKIGFAGTILGGPAMARRNFVAAAGESAEGVLLPLLYDSSSPAALRFARSFFERHQRPPDFADAHAYDSVRMLLAAIQRAGLNRARIREAMQNLSPWEGVTGPITWDAVGANSRGVLLGTIREGRPVPMSP
jgi:ABC-type branched-subunit amino acid transport system substrate-binding protein